MLRPLEKFGGRAEQEAMTVQELKMKELKEINLFSEDG